MRPAARDSKGAPPPSLHPCRRETRTTPETRGPRSRRMRRVEHERAVDPDVSMPTPGSTSGGITAAARMPLPMSMTMTQSANPCLACAARSCRPRCRCRPCGCRRRRRKSRREAAEHGAEEIRQRDLESELDHALPFPGISCSSKAMLRRGHSPSHARRRSRTLRLAAASRATAGSRCRAARLLSTMPTSRARRRGTRSP